MKFKVIANLVDGVIAANNNNIVCFKENSLRDKNGEDSLYDSEGIYIGQILTEKMHRNADIYWWYTKKEWTQMNKMFMKIHKKTQNKKA
jgi:hypothetical protein